MYTYVIGDIHGCYNEFLHMLDKIDCQDDDEIICVGDYIDRGSQSYEMLKWIESFPDNFLLIQGNHEAEFTANIDILISFSQQIGLNSNDIEDTKVLYRAVSMIPQIHEAHFDYYNTINVLIHKYHTTLAELSKWSYIMKQMPYMYTKTVNGTKYIITHAGYRRNDIDYNLYAREESFSNNNVVIAGHTPTIMNDMFAYNNGNIYEKYDSIYNGKYINIDCGCAYKNDKHAKLACIRLEDMIKFYVIS